MFKIISIVTIIILIILLFIVARCKTKEKNDDIYKPNRYKKGGK